MPATLTTGCLRLRLVLGLLAIGCMVSDAVGQRSAMPSDGSLPPALVAHFSDAYSDVMDLSPAGSVDASVVVTFSPCSVDFSWVASTREQGQIAQAHAVKVAESVSFLATAVCRASAKNNVIFVAGWDQRTRSCVIEKWTFGLGAFSLTDHPDSDGCFWAFSPPEVKREVLYRSNAGIAAVEGMAYHPVSRTLLLLEEGPDANLHTLGMDGVLTEIADASSIPQLASMKDVRIGAHEDMPFAFFLLSERAWSHSFARSFVVIPDANGDGVVEVSNALALDQERVDRVFSPDGWLEVN